MGGVDEAKEDWRFKFASKLFFLCYELLWPKEEAKGQSAWQGMCKKVLRRNNQVLPPSTSGSLLH